MSDAVAQPVRATRSRRTRLFVLLGILVLLIAYTGCDLWAGRRLDAEIARLEPKYGNLRVPSYSFTDPSPNNQARYVRAAAALMIRPTAETWDGLSKLREARDTGAIPPALRVFVEDNHEAIQMAARIVPRSEMTWRDDPEGAPLASLRNLSELLSISSMFEIERKRPDEATQRILRGLTSVSSLNHERSLISQLVRIAAAEYQFIAIQRLVTQSDPSKTSLSELAGALADSRATDPIKLGLQEELMTFSRAMATLESGYRTGVPGYESVPGMGFLGRVGRPFIRMAHIRFLERMDQLLAIEAGPRPKPAAGLAPASWWSPIDRFVSIGLTGLERTVESGDDFIGVLGAAEIAVALRRHKLDRGEYPSDLSALVPSYLDRLPINPFTGKVPVYARDGAGFTLHAPHGDIYLGEKRPTPDWKVGK